MMTIGTIMDEQSGKVIRAHITFTSGKIVVLTKNEWEECEAKLRAVEQQGMFRKG
jgi:hypothetical protein